MLGRRVWGGEKGRTFYGVCGSPGSTHMPAHACTRPLKPAHAQGRVLRFPLGKEGDSTAGGPDCVARAPHWPGTTPPLQGPLTELPPPPADTRAPGARVPGQSRLVPEPLPFLWCLPFWGREGHPGNLLTFPGAQLSSP